jgi:hypothetical protein
MAQDLKSTANWHQRIALELENPVLPEGVSEERKKEIEAQKEQHKVFAKALRRLDEEAKKN